MVNKLTKIQINVAARMISAMTLYASDIMAMGDLSDDDGEALMKEVHRHAEKLLRGRLPANIGSSDGIIKWVTENY